MAKLPYPPAPELGWYSDDPVEGTPDSAVGTAEPQNDYGQPSSAETAANTAFAAEPAATAATAAAEPAATASADTTPHAAENDIEDWDGTVLSSSFTSKAPKKTYLMHNDVTGQTIVIDKSTLLGRKPSMDVPQGAKVERIEDPTRTTSFGVRCCEVVRIGGHRRTHHLGINMGAALFGMLVFFQQQCSCALAHHHTGGHHSG